MATLDPKYGAVHEDHYSTSEATIEAGDEADEPKLSDETETNKKEIVTEKEEPQQNEHENEKEGKDSEDMEHL